MAISSPLLNLRVFDSILANGNKSDRTSRKRENDRPSSVFKVGAPCDAYYGCYLTTRTWDKG